jgi:UDP-glucose 4-epimerase
MKYIVTGGAGFIGSHLVESLVKQNKKVVVLDNLSTGRLDNIKPFLKKIKFIKCDISKKGKWIKEFNQKCYIFHLAALADIVPSMQNPEKYFDSNVRGTLNLLEACRNIKVVKFLYSASSSCYGIPIKYPTKENEKIDPMYPYALTKKLGEDLLIHWSKVYNIPFASLRLFNVYGTRSRTSGTYGAMFGVFLAQKISGKPFTIVGDGKQTRDFTYVSDIVSAFLKASKSKLNNEIFNVGSGETISVNKIAQILGGKKVYIKKRPGEPDCTFADITKIKKKLKWSPKVKIEEGMKMLIENIDYWKKAPVWTPKTINKATSLWFKYLAR